MNTHLDHLEETRQFVKDNLTQIVKEIFDWNCTEKLPEGKFREAVRKLGYVSSMGTYGKNSYVTGKFHMIREMVNDMLLKQHLIRAGYFGENI